MGVLEMTINQRKPPQPKICIVLEQESEDRLPESQNSCHTLSSIYDYFH